MLTIRRRGLELRDSSTSILPLLPRLHAVFQGKAVGVSVGSSHRPVLVVSQVFFPPGGPLLVVSLKHTRAGSSAGPGRGCVSNTNPSFLSGPSAIQRELLRWTNHENFFVLFLFCWPLVSSLLCFLRISLK